MNQKNQPVRYLSVLSCHKHPVISRPHWLYWSQEHPQGGGLANSDKCCLGYIQLSSDRCLRCSLQFLHGGRLHEAEVPGLHGGRALLRQAGRQGHRRGQDSICALDLGLWFRVFGVGLHQPASLFIFSSMYLATLFLRKYLNALLAYIHEEVDVSFLPHKIFWLLRAGLEH